MKPRKIFHLFRIAITTAVLFSVWLFHSNSKKEWPGVQLRRAAELGVSLHTYREKHGDYPDSLDQLVRSGQLSASTFAGLYFQASQDADREPWKYTKPVSSGDIAISSPSPVCLGGGSSDRFVISRADGSAEVLVADEVPRVQAKSK